MRKITYRANDDPPDRVALPETSKAEVMREAIRAYNDGELDQQAVARGGRANARTHTYTVTFALDRAAANATGERKAGFRQSSDRARRPSDVHNRSDDSDVVAGVVGGAPGDVSGQNGPVGSTRIEGAIIRRTPGETASNRAVFEWSDEVCRAWAVRASDGRARPTVDVLDRLN